MKKLFLFCLTLCLSCIVQTIIASPPGLHLKSLEVIRPNSIQSDSSVLTDSGMYHPGVSPNVSKPAPFYLNQASNNILNSIPDSAIIKVTYDSIYYPGDSIVIYPVTWNIYYPKGLTCDYVYYPVVVIHDASHNPQKIPSSTIFPYTVLMQPGVNPYIYVYDTVYIPEGVVYLDTVYCWVGWPVVIEVDTFWNNGNPASFNCFVSPVPQKKATGINSAKTSKISFYPNPAHDYIYVSDEVKETTIVNLIGKMVLNVKGPVSSITVSTLPDGTYIVRFVKNDGNIETAKLIKR